MLSAGVVVVQQKTHCMLTLLGGVQVFQAVQAGRPSPLKQSRGILQRLAPAHTPTELHTITQQGVQVIASLHDDSPVLLQDGHAGKQVQVGRVGVAPQRLPELEHL